MKKLLPFLAIGSIGLAAYAYSKSAGTPPAGGGNADSANAGGEAVGSGFPLAQGAKGALVKDIQAVLSRRGLIPANEVDGIFGPKTAAALAKAGYPAIIAKSDYERILSESSAAPEAALSTGYRLADVVLQVQYFELGKLSTEAEALKVLSFLGNVSDYRRVSEEVKKAYWAKGKTLAQLVLDKFYISPSAKSRIESRLLAIGLRKSPNGIWLSESLSGIGGTLAMALADGSGTALDGSTINFPARSIAGRHLRTRQGFAYIENSGTVYAVPSSIIARIPG